MTIDIQGHRTDPAADQWDLPPWGHALSQGVMPLFVTTADHLFPVGTASTFGRGVTFIISAAHNVYESLKHEPRLTHALLQDKLPTSIDLKQAGLCVMGNRILADGRIQFVIWPLETVEAAPPTDVVFGFPQLQNHFPTLVSRLGFDLPAIGQKIWSIGYTDFKYPCDGIPLAAVRDGTFNWRDDYHHRFVVVEGRVQHIFVQKFAAGFVGGPCFVFDAEIPHALSGGPVMTLDGTVIGVNSAGATSFFNRPASIVSLLYPLLFSSLRFGADLAQQVRVNSSRTLLDLIAIGIVATDGSEKLVAVGRNEDGALLVTPRAPIAMQGFIHDDFASFQRGIPPTKYDGVRYRLRRDEVGQ